MAANAGPDIVEDGIVFYYDTDNTVKSFIGEPTTNFATNTPTPSGWPGNYTLIDGGTKTFDFVTSTVEWGGDASWTIHYYDVTAYTGQHVCLSATYEYSTSPGGGNLAFVMIGQTTGSQTYLGYSSPLDYNSYNPTPGQQISWNGVIGDGGKIGILTWMNNGNSTTLTSRFSKVQLEVKTHPTQFVNGTRSVTQGLLNMFGTSTINITNATFDNNAQIEFDGTNDYIDSGYDLSWNNASSASIELMVKPYTVSGGNYGIIGKEYPNWEWAFYQYNSSLSLVYWNTSGGHSNGMDFSVNAFPTANTWYHIVYTWNGSTSIFYVNGVALGSKVATDPSINQNRSNNVMVGGHTYVWADSYFNGKLDLVKFYNRNLTASEVLTNYNALKTRFGI
jgi:hypothetical protein